MGTAVVNWEVIMTRRAPLFKARAASYILNRISFHVMEADLTAASGASVRSCGVAK